MSKSDNEKGKEPLVSVIIAFYNVEKYADSCMTSLVHQDYKNCEFICVDDGSTDDTLDILKKYSFDERVKIVHKKNGGLSDARNYGLELARGDYISIIDGDDYVHPKYLTFLVNEAVRQSEIIVISPLRLVKYTDPLDIRVGWPNEVTYTVLNKRETFEKILYDEVSASACGKLVPRRAYDNIRFPVGKVSEEVATIGTLISKFEKISIVNQPLYGYVMRPTSLGHKNNLQFQEIQDRIDSLKTLEKVLKQEFDITKDIDLKKALQYRWGLRLVDMATMYDKVADDKASVTELKAKVNNWLRRNIRQIVSNRRARLAQRVRMWIYTFFPKLYIFLYSTYQKLKYDV